MNDKKEEKLRQIGREQIAKPVAKKIRQIGNELENYVERTANDSEFVLDVVYESEVEKKDESLGIERMTTFADLEEEHDVAIVLGLFRKYCNENGYYENSVEIFDFVKKIGNAERIPSYCVNVSYEDIKKAEDKDEVSEVLFELISLCSSLFGYNEDIYNELCKHLTISQNDLESIKKYIDGNVKNYELSKWAEMLLGQTGRMDNAPDSYDSSGLSDRSENAQDQGENGDFEALGTDNIHSGIPSWEDAAQKTDSVIREIVNKYANKISGKLKFDDEQWQKILITSGYDDIAMPSVYAIFKSGMKIVIVTICAVYYIDKLDKNKNWKIRYSDLKEVKFDQMKNTISLWADEKYTIEWKKGFESIARMFDEIKEKGQYAQSDRYIQPRNMERKNRICYVAIVDYIIKQVKCEDFEVFRMASKYKVEGDWEVIANLISTNKSYSDYLKMLMDSPELMYSKKSVAISLITDVCSSYLYAQKEDGYGLPPLINRYFDELKTYLSGSEDKNHNLDKVISLTVEVALKEKQLLENKISFDEYSKAIENMAAIVGAAGIFGVVYAFAWGPLLFVFMTFAPGIGQIAAAALAGGLLIKRMAKKVRNKNEEEKDMKKMSIYEYACQYAYAQNACERIGDYETAGKLKKNRKKLFEKTGISFSVRVPNVGNDIFAQIRELLVNGLEECTSWESYPQLSGETMLILKNALGDVAEKYGIHFSEKDIIGIYKEMSWKDDYNYMKYQHLCRCVVFCKEGLLYKGVDDPHYVRYVDFDCVKMIEPNSIIGVFYKPKGLGFVLGSEYDCPTIHKMLSKIFDIVKNGCTVYS